MRDAAADSRGVQESAAAWGLVVDPADLPPPDVCEVWAEHWPAVRLFGAMLTQWRDTPNGPGLVLEALPVVERRLGISRRQARLAFDHLRVMEAEARDWWAERGG